MDYETEEQQVEAIKKWWSENAISVIAGVAIGAAAIFGWVGWGKYQESQSQKASDGFVQTLEALEQDGEAVAVAADSVKDDHGGSLYAVMAALAAAKGLAESGDLNGAEEQLTWAVKEAESDDIRILAKVRLARVLGAAGKADDGLKELPASPKSRFVGLVEEARGDLYLIQGDKDKARSAYQKALDSGERIGDNRVLTMKLNDLAVASDEQS